MITIQGEIHSSKNSRRVFRTPKGRTIVAKSEQAQTDEQLFALQLIMQRAEWAKQLDKYTSDPMRIVFRFRRRTRARFDYINLAQGVCDAMVKAGYVPDDDADHLLPVFAPYVVDRDNPGVDIWIE